MTIAKTYEKTGLLYLGRELDFHGTPLGNAPFLYKNSNLTTHGILIGMTGSGKTGLGIGLIEEAIMDSVPSIIIDPKGDMGNLLLSFPECRKEDFLPWIDTAEAARKNLSHEKLAEKTAEKWQNGLKDWGQDLSRIATLRAQTDMTIYTPGSSAGVPVSVLAGFTAPDSETLEDADTINSMVNATVTSLLALINIEGDPLQSREHILVSSLLLHHWRRGESPDMERLIGGIVSPPFQKVGVFPLDSFYPQSERMKLAMNLNNIIASPGFTAWTTGEPLDIQRLLYDDNGRPRTAIFSIAHLSERERMFFVTMLLNRFIGWMRRQQGSSSLKALLYMDEIFGYFPPTANPPSKKPMMLLLKQARAFGVGVLLATQNPVDLDYKGLSNIGSWFVGHLQTRQDQDRVIAGIVGASDGQLDMAAVREILVDMKGRQFLLNSVHLEEPVLFETRWVMSYLKGPMAKNDIRKLMEIKKKEADKPQLPIITKGQHGAGAAPLLPDTIPQQFHLVSPLGAPPLFSPWLGVSASVRFYNAKRNIDRVETCNQRLYLNPEWTKPEWQVLETHEIDTSDWLSTAPDEAQFYPLPTAVSGLTNMSGLEKDFADYLYQHRRLELFRVAKLKLESTPEEPLADFKVRLGDLLREMREEEAEKLREKYAGKQRRLEERLKRALARVDKEQQDVQSKTADTLVSFGTAVLGAFFGRKTFSATNIRRAASGMRNVGRVSKEKGDVRRAEEMVEGVQLDIEALAVEIEEKLAQLAEEFSPEKYEVETFAIKPRRADIFDVEIVLLWDIA